MYKAIVFDLDGTLVDSPLCFKSIRQQLGIPDGEYILEYLDQLAPDIKAGKHKTLQEIEMHAARNAIPFPGVLELLLELRRAKILVGIFTRNCRAVANHVIQTFELKIDMVITREDAPAKPDPTGLLKFLNEWRLGSQDLLYVGDFRFDIECGKKAGVRTALFTNGQPSVPELFPDHVVSHYGEFLDACDMGM